MKLMENSRAKYCISRKKYHEFKWIYRIEKRKNKITALIIYEEDNQKITIYVYYREDSYPGWLELDSILKTRIRRGRKIEMRANFDTLPSFFSETLKNMKRKLR